MEALKRISKIAGALADPGRAKAVLALKGKTLCICHVVELLGLSFPTVSRHVAILEDAGLIVTEKRGKWTYCSLPGRDGDKAALAAIRWLNSASAAACAEADGVRKPGPPSAVKKASASCGKMKKQEAPWLRK